MSIESLKFSSNSETYIEESKIANVASASWEGKTLAVGSKQIASYLKQLVFMLQLPLQIKTEKIKWIRDCRVKLPNQHHLIPYPLKIKRLVANLISYFPKEMSHFQNQNNNPIGWGFCDGYRARAFQVARRNQVPFIKGKTCIEGGNCRIFTGSDGKPKALIGYISLILSLLSLKKQKFFKNTEYQSIEDLQDQSELLRIAKNLHLANKKKSLFSEVDKACQKEAAYIGFMLEKSKEVIAQEIGIPLNRIAFLLQDRFHIDMEVFNGPDDFVFLHDETQVSATLNKFKQQVENGGIEPSKERLERSSPILQKNIEMLKKIGCKPILVPGVFALHKKISDKVWLTESINFMNGLVLEGPNPHFITNGTSKDCLGSLLEKEFVQKIYDACPSLRISFIKGDLPGTLNFDDGGLNCMTSIEN